MIRDDVCYLITETPAEHGLFDKPRRRGRMVYCRIKSVRSSEFWQAKTAGSELSAVFELADYHEYNGERLLLWKDGEQPRYYKITRTYVTGQGIELTCEEADAYDGEPDLCS